jgi:hypothetical protein
MKAVAPMIAATFGLLLATAPCFVQQDAAAETLVCTSSFEGGSGVVESIDQQTRTVRIRPAEHKDRGWTCWWYVRVTGIRRGETIAVDLGGGLGDWAKPDRAAFSTDGRTWAHTAPGQRGPQRIVYRQKVDAGQAWFAWGPPFVPSDARRLVTETAGRCRFAEAFELCRTREGRPVPALRIAQPGAGDEQRFGVWIVARQHAWETGGSWVARGLVDWLSSGDPRAEALRKKSLVTVVPIMDVDNVFLGAGGKNQKPHDHNRDWSDQPHWPSVGAAVAGIKKMDSRGRFDLFLDLHNPGRGDRRPFFFLPPESLMGELGQSNQKRFLDAVRAEFAGPLKLADKMKVSGPGYDPGWQRISNTWVAAHTRPHGVAMCLETPWDTPHSTAEGYLAVGRQLGLAVERYFRENPRGDAKPQER